MKKLIVTILIVILSTLSFVGCSWKDGEELVPKEFKELELGKTITIVNSALYKTSFTSKKLLEEKFVNVIKCNTIYNQDLEPQIILSVVGSNYKVICDIKCYYRIIGDALEIKTSEKYTLLYPELTPDIENAYDVHRGSDGYLYAIYQNVDISKYSVNNSKLHHFEYGNDKTLDVTLYHMNGDETFFFYGDMYIYIN